MGDFRTQKCFMTHVTHDTCDLLLFPEKKMKKVAKRFVNRNENVVTLQPRWVMNEECRVKKV